MALKFAFAGADEILRGVRAREFSVSEVASYFLERIERLDPLMHAWVTVDAAAVAFRAKQLDRNFGEWAERPLFGVPVGVKDVTPTAGLRTTFGSDLYRRYVPRASAVVVERLVAAGALILGKTNTPEFGAGGNTVSSVRGATRNPWDLSRTAGGSSGGSAAALAAGMCTVATGTDLGGSLRIPATYCGVVGFRTSPGLVPNAPTLLPWDGLSVVGPLARNVADVERTLQCIAGRDSRAPLSVGFSGVAADAGHLGIPKVAVSIGDDLIDVDPLVVEAVRAASALLERLGCALVDDRPDLRGIKRVVDTLRIARNAALYRDIVVDDPRSHHPGLVSDVRRGSRLSAMDIAAAEIARGRIFERAVRFWEKYDFLVLPGVPIPPFPVEILAPRRIGARKMRTYTGWMILTHAISMMGWPALALPSSITPDGHPLGVQLIAPPGREADVLSLGRRYDELAAWRNRFPPSDVFAA